MGGTRAPLLPNVIDTNRAREGTESQLMQTLQFVCKSVQHYLEPHHPPARADKVRLVQFGAHFKLVGALSAPLCRYLYESIRSDIFDLTWRPDVHGAYIRLKKRLVPGGVMERPKQR